MSVPLVFMTRFFQLVSERKFAEAERVLERLDAKMGKKGRSEFNRGYLDALKGIVLTYRSGSDAYAFFSSLDLKNTEALKRHYGDFARNVDDRFHADYDRGYFSALADYMRVVLKTGQSHA